MKKPSFKIFSSVSTGIHEPKSLPNPYHAPSDVYVPPPSFPSIVQSEPLPPVLPWSPPPPGYEYSQDCRQESSSKGMNTWTEVALIAGTGLILFLALK